MPKRNGVMKSLTKRQQAAVWNQVWHWPADMKGALAVRTVQRVMDEQNTDLVEIALDRDGTSGEEPGRQIYLLAVRGDGTIGALSRAAEAIGRAFPGRSRSLAGEDGTRSTPLAEARQTNLSDEELAKASNFAGRAAGKETFTAPLLRLIAGADALNRERLRIAFPEAVRAWEQWRKGVARG